MRQYTGDPLALVLDRMNTIIDLLKMMVGIRPDSADPALLELLAKRSTPVDLARQGNRLLEYLVAASLPSAPANVKTITVGTTEVLLASNESQPLMRVDITNLNVAQPVNVSKRGVTINSGVQVVAQQTQPFVLPVGAQLYGVVALGTILVSVADGYDMRPMLNAVIGVTG